MSRADGKRLEVDKIYKSFIIGCGKIAGYSNDGSINDFTHGYGYINNPHVNIVGCMDCDKKKNNLFADKFNCVPYDQYEKGIIETKPDIVSICTPDHTHYKILKSLLKMEYKIRIIFIEKPICKSMIEMDELINLSNSMGIDIIVNHTNRFDNRYLQLQNKIKKGAFGELTNGYVTYYSG